MVDATRITLISLRLIQQETQREALTKFYQMPKVIQLKTKSIHIVYLNEKIEINIGLQNSLGQNYNEKIINKRKHIWHGPSN